MLVKKRSLAILIATACLGASQLINAAGFALIEQSVSGMGTAYAGGAALASDTSTLFFNPAGMTRLKGTRASAAVHLVLPQSKFSNNGSTHDGIFMGGAAISGGDGGDAGGLAAVPHTYITHQVNDSLWLGFAVNAPFGLTTEYSSNWVGRYHAIKSAVKTINLNPSIAYKVNDNVSLAAGVSAMYLDGEFTNAIDFGGLNQIPTALGGLGGALGPAVAGTADGKSRIEGNSWGWGFNLGALFDISQDTRLGLHYRSEVRQKIEGDVKFALPTPALAGIFSNADVKSTIDLPATASISIHHQLNSEFAVMADYTWTGWSSIPELRFDFDNSLPDGVSTFDWKDTKRIAVGTSYKPSGSEWTYRFGVAFDESPIRNKELRTPRLPDEDRIWVAIGAGYSPTEHLTFDFGYAHLFIDDPVIAKTATGEDLTRGALNGSYDSTVDILSIQGEYRFY